MTITQIFAGLTNAGLSTPTDQFVDVDFLAFGTPTLNNDEGYEISLMLRIVLPAIGERTLYEAIADTQNIVRIPAELGKSGFPLKAYVATPFQVQIILYAINQDRNTGAEFTTTFGDADLDGGGAIAINHGLNKSAPLVAVYDAQGLLILPDAVALVTDNDLVITLETFRPLQGIFTVRIA